jgi:hypothetical protein
MIRIRVGTGPVGFSSVPRGHFKKNLVSEMGTVRVFRKINRTEPNRTDDFFGNPRTEPTEPNRVEI